MRLGNIGDWGSGSTPAKGRPDYYGGNILWLRTGELNNGTVYDTEIKITEKALNECSFRLNKVGDVMIAMYGATIGKVAIAGKEMTTNQACCGCTPICILNKYLFYFLMGSQEDFIKKGEGGAQPNISREKIVAHLMPLPPFEEQNRIVEKIESVLPLIELYGKSQDKLNALNKSIFPLLRKSVLQEAIQGKLVPQDPNDEPASVLLERIKEEKAKLFKEGKLKKKDLVDSVIFKGDDNKYYEKVGSQVTCIDDNIPFDIPSSWSWIRLGNYTEVIGGYAFQSQDIKSENGCRVIRISDISEEGLVNTRIARYNGELDFSQYRIYNNDILMAMTGGTVGKSLLIKSVNNEVLLLNQRVAIIRNRWFDVNYIDTVIKSAYIKSIIDNSKNSTNDNISMADITGFLIPIPPLNEQRRIINKLEFVIASIMRR